MKLSSWAILVGFISLAASIFYAPVGWSAKFLLLACLLFALSGMISND